MGNIGISELLLLIFLVLLLFGARRIPEIGASLGKALKEFRKANRESGEPPESENSKNPSGTKKES